MKAWLFVVTMLAGLATLSLPAAAATNLFPCAADYGFIIGHCQVKAFELSPLPAWEDESFEADFTVTYSFSCVGHQPEIGVASGDTFKRFELGADHARVLLSGSRHLTTFDRDPGQTFELSYRPGCRLIVHGTTLSPSAQALGQWRREARLQGRLIDHAVDTYLLAVDFASYRAWDMSRVSSLIDSISQKITLFDELCAAGDEGACISTVHFAAVRGALQRKLDQTPELPEPGTMQPDIGSVQAYYEQDLREEALAGDRMQRRFQDFQTTVETALAAALARVPEQGR